MNQLISNSSYSDTKAKEVDLLTRGTIFSLIKMYKGKAINELLLDTISKFIVSLTSEELNLVTTTGTINSLSLNKRNIFLRVFNYNSNLVNNILTNLWDKSFNLGIKHNIGDILDDLGIFDKVNDKVKFSKSNTNMASFATKKEKQDVANEKKAKKKANLLRKNKESLQSDSSEAAKVAQIVSKQRLSYLDSVTDINNAANRGKALKDKYLSSFYMRQRKRVLSLDYARKYDYEIKKKIRDFLQDDISNIKSIRALPISVSVLEQNIRQNLVQKKVIQNINDSAPSARRIVRTELVLAYNFGKLSGLTHPDDIDRLVRWNADWELQARIPGYEICQPCKSMHARVFSVRTILQNGAMTDIGLINYAGTRQTKTDFKNPAIPILPFHPSCSCFWRVLSQKEAAAEDIVTQVTEGLKAAVPYVVAGSILVGGGFLLSRSNAFKSFIKTALGDTGDILQTTYPSIRINASPRTTVEPFVSSVTKRNRAAQALDIQTGLPLVQKVVPSSVPSTSPISPVIPTTIPINTNQEVQNAVEAVQDIIDKPTAELFKIQIGQLQ